MERPKNENISRCRVVSFTNEEEWHKVLVRGNDRNAVGTTLSVWGRSTERLRRKVERWVTSGPSGPRSCRSDLVPRSRVVPNHPRTIWDFRTMPEQGRNEEGGWAKVGVFPPKKRIIPVAFHYRSDSFRNSQSISDLKMTKNLILLPSLVLQSFLSHLNSFQGHSVIPVFSNAPRTRTPFVWVSFDHHLNHSSGPCQGFSQSLETYPASGG